MPRLAQLVEHLTVVVHRRYQIVFGSIPKAGSVKLFEEEGWGREEGRQGEHLRLLEDGRSLVDSFCLEQGLGKMVEASFCSSIE